MNRAPLCSRARLRPFLIVCATAMTLRAAATAQAGERRTRHHRPDAVSVTNGTHTSTLPAFSITVENGAAAGTGNATLSWQPPTENTDAAR
ncbi:MAG TPA: hypothetical protein VMT66_07420 [Steroidobacteraceae bacterium]|nr:hypothetical protein [Steroidobacteraceae bacterium]